MSAPVYLVLLHHPMTNRRGEVITTAVTNLDLHDIARSCRTYGLRRYFVVTPLEVQHTLVARILAHWKSETSQTYHPDRYEALKLIEVCRDFEEVRERIRQETGEFPEVVLTDARPQKDPVSYSEYRKTLLEPARTRPAVIVFGTGWGVAEVFHPVVDRILAPIDGRKSEEDRKANRGAYNHLSVRAAVAISLDRLLG